MRFPTLPAKRQNAVPLRCPRLFEGGPHRVLSSIRTPRTRLPVQGEQGDVRYTCCVLRVPPHVGICATRELRIRSVKIPSTRTFSIILSIIQNTSYTTDFAWLFTFRKRSHEHLLYNTMYYPKHVVQNRFRMVGWRAANVFFLTDDRALESPDFTEYKAEVVHVDSSAQDLLQWARRSSVQPPRRNVRREEWEDSESDPDVHDVYHDLMRHKEALLPPRSGAHCATPNDSVALLLRLHAHVQAGTWPARRTRKPGTMRSCTRCTACVWVWGRSPTALHHGYTLAMFSIL